MKILQVCSISHLLFEPSGSAKIAYELSDKLSSNSHMVCLLTTVKHNNGGIQKIVKVNDKFIVFHCSLLFKPLAYRYRFYVISHTDLKILSDTVRYADVVHIHDYRSSLSIHVARYARKYNIPYIVQAHGSLPRIMAKQRLKWIYDVFFGHTLLRDASKVIALSQMEAQQYRAMGVPDEKIEVIPNGLDLLEYANLPSKGSFKKKLSIDDSDRMIFYLGRIHKTKGIDFLVKAYAYLTKNMKYKNAVLVIAGPDDGYLAEAKSLSDSSSISDSVLFTGPISSEDKLKALVDADVFVTPSFYGFPMTFLEACATGTPIIATTLGDRLPWINGNVGYVTLPTQPDLARAIYAIISDDELHEKFSRNCRKIVKCEFSLDKIVDRLKQVYGEVAEG